MASALRREMTDHGMSVEEADIRRKMGEIADWLRAQAELQAPLPHLRAVPPAPELDVEPEIAAEVLAETESEPQPTSLEDADENSLNEILQRRIAARRARELDSEPETGSLREVMSRFSGPINHARHPLRAAVADIVGRQRELEQDLLSAPVAFEEDLELLPIAEPELEPEQEEEPAPRPFEASVQMEAAFESFVTRFEERAAQTFQTLDASLADVKRLVEDAKTPIEAAEAAAAYIVQTRLHALESDTHGRIEAVARDLADLRAETKDSERRAHELLDAVRDTLEQVAARLPASLNQTPHPEANPTLRARAAALQAVEESLELETTPTARPAPAAPERRRFIAAARRSSQSTDETAPLPKYSAPAAPRLRAVPVSDAEKAGVGGRIKRGLLAATAAAALLAGIYAGSSRFLDGMFADQQLALAPVEAGSDIAVNDSKDVVPAPMLSSEPVAGGAQTAFVPDEPATTGSLPEKPLAPLPAEIGSGKLRSMAENGDAAAQYEVAMRFTEGRGVPRDAEQGAGWFERAAHQGLAPAQYRLGSLTEKGTGVAKNLEAARVLYEQAAATGNIQSMHNLGVLYADGAFGKPDMTTALVWFQKAAEYGVKDSQYNLGIFYAKGMAVAQDFAQSYLWFTLAAAQGDKDAAAKREQIAAKLDAEKIKALKVKADTWQPLGAALEANTVTAPMDGWDEMPSGRAATTAKPKAK